MHLSTFMDQNSPVKSSQNTLMGLVYRNTFKKVYLDYHIKTSIFGYYQDYLNRTHSYIVFENNMMLTMNFSQRKMSQLV